MSFTGRTHTVWQEDLFIVKQAPTSVQRTVHLSGAAGGQLGWSHGWGGLCRGVALPLPLRGGGLLPLSCSILVCRQGCGPGLAPSEAICERNALTAVKMPNQLSSASQAVEGHVRPRLSSFFSIQCQDSHFCLHLWVEEGPGWRSLQALLELGGSVRLWLWRSPEPLNPPQAAVPF